MIEFSKEFFSIEDTLLCGQVFRYMPYKNGYTLISLDKVAYLYYKADKVVIESTDDEYFYNYFDLAKDYRPIYEKALSLNIDCLTKAAEFGKGIRILKQDFTETLFSFIVSQNNFIPRIKRTIEGLCQALGEKITAFGMDFFAFPTIEKLSECDKEFFEKIGLGYRAEYFVSVAKTLLNDAFVEGVKGENEDNQRNMLLSLKGVGQKVCDCIMLFALQRTNSFPVDTWVEKIYHQEFKGTLTDRKKISKYFSSRFKDYSGYIQQYLFHYKRSIK